jgi:hypothetical protein
VKDHPFFRQIFGRQGGTEAFVPLPLQMDRPMSQGGRLGSLGGTPAEGRRSSEPLSRLVPPPGSPSGVVPLRSSADDLPSAPSVLCAQGRE